MWRNYADIFRDYFRASLTMFKETDKKLRRPTPLKWWAHGAPKIFGCCRGLIRQWMQSKLLNNDSYENFIPIIRPITSSAKLKLRMELFKKPQSWAARKLTDASRRRFLKVLCKRMSLNCSAFKRKWIPLLIPFLRVLFSARPCRA